MAAKPYRPKMTAAEKKAYKNRNFGVQGKTGGMGGKYGRKSTNLTQKQLKAAGAAKAAKKRTVDISQTRREGGFTLGPGGKPLTGTVKLSNGRLAVYKGGKRVQAGAAAGMKQKQKPVTPRGGGGGGRTSATAPKANAQGSRIANTTASRVGGYTPGSGSTTRPRGNRAATSGTVTSAIAKGKAMGATKKNKKRSWQTDDPFVIGAKGIYNAFRLK